MLRPETRARARAVQLLYAWDLQSRPPLNEVAAALAGEGAAEGQRWRSGLELARRVAADVDRLDEAIAATAEHWRLERLGVVERNILRLGALELTASATPPAVVIDEAVRLARWFAGPQAPAFVNGVLDALARRLGRL